MADGQPVLRLRRFFRIAIIAGPLGFAFWSSSCRAERSTFVTEGPNQGLSSLDGTSLAEDRAGDILLATEHGVFAYDGRRFENLGVQNGLRDGGEVFNVSLARSGLLAIEYPGELYLSDRPSDASHPVTSLNFRLVDHPGLTFYSERPHRLASWGSGFVFLAGDQPVLVDQAKHEAPHFASLPYDRAEQSLVYGAAAVFSVDNRLWEAFDNGRICATDPGAVRCYSAADGLVGGPWVDVVADGHGRVVARSASSFAVLDPGSHRWTASELPDQGGSYDAYAPDLGLFRTPDGLLVTQANQGLDVLRPEGWQELTVTDGAPSGTISDALTDSTGQLWFHVLGRGLVRWVGYNHWSTIERSDGLSAGYPWETVRSRDGGLWVTTDDGVDEVARNGAAVHVSRVFPGASYALAASPAGGIWAGYRDKGLREIDPSTGVTTIIRMPAVETIVPDSSHGIWVGTDAGLFRIPENDQAPYHPALVQALKTPVNSIRPDGRGGAYFLCAGRLQHWHADGSNVTIAGPWPTGTIEPLAMATARDGSFWIGGPGGLLRVIIIGDQIASLEKISSEDTRTNTIYAVMVDHRGWVWVGTDHGVSVYDGRHWVTVDASDGLLSDDVNQDGIREDPDGSIYIVTSRGVAHLRDPGSLFQAAPLSVVVTRATLGSSPVSNVTMPFNRDPLLIELGTPNHGVERSVSFRYRLSGVDADWVVSSTGVVRYPFVPPGRHMLTIIGDDLLSHHASAPAYLNVDIGYPWWRQWWADCLWLIAGAGVGYIGMRLRHRAMYARQAELKRHVAEATAQIRHQATHDQLTGLLVRGEVERRLAERLQYGRAADEFVVALLDVDHFKLVNDNHGHLGGDEVLRALGRLVARVLRADEFAGRYGGEEILLVLDDGDGCAAERVLSLQLAVRHDTFKAGQYGINVTCSIGLAWALRGDNWETLIGRTDAALYEAKNGGRDRVVESRLHDTPAASAR